MTCTFLLYRTKIDDQNISWQKELCVNLRTQGVLIIFCLVASLWDHLITWLVVDFWPNNWQNSNICCNYNKQCTYIQEFKLRGGVTFCLGFLDMSLFLLVGFQPMLSWCFCIVFVFELVNNYSQDSVYPWLQFLCIRDKKRVMDPKSKAMLQDGTTMNSFPSCDKYTKIMHHSDDKYYII